MTIWSNLKRYAIYRRLLSSYLILVTISVLLISAMLYQRFAYQVESEINQVSMSRLDYLRSATDAIHNQVLAVGNELLHDPAVITAMLNDEFDPLLENEVVLQFRRVQSVYSFISYISIYNEKTERYLNNRGIDKEVDDEVIRLIGSNGGSRYMDFVPRLLHAGDFLPNASGTERLLTFVLYSNFSNLIPKNGALIININEAELIGKLLGDLSDSQDHLWMVADREGTILSHNDPGMFMTSIADAPYFQEISRTLTDKGHFTERMNGSRQLVVYAELDKLDWRIIGMRPYELPFFGITEPRTVSWAVGTALLAIGAALAVLLAGRMYKPYSVFQSKHRTLETSLNYAYPVLRESYVRGLLSGKADAQAGRAGLLSLSPPLTEAYFCVIVLSIDDYKLFCRRSYKEQDLLRFAIRNITEELLFRQGRYHSLEVESDHLVVFAPLDRPNLPDNFVLTLIELQQTIRQYFKLSVSVGIGDVVDAQEKVKDAYRSAKELLKYRLMLGHGSIIDRASVGDRMALSHDYPARAVTAMLEAVGLGRRKEAEAEIAKFISAIRPFRYNHVHMDLNQLIIAVQKKYGSALSPEDYELHGSLLYSLSDLETLEEVEGALRELCFAIIGRLEESKGSRNAELIETVRLLIQERYNDPNLSLDAIAEQVHYSSGYLSKLFKQETDQSFNDCVNAVRLEEAVRLLTTTGDSAAAISEKIGLGSSTYFFTLFKKTYGMTPAQYRTRHSLADLAAKKRIE